MAKGQITFHFCLDRHVRANGDQMVYLRATQEKKSVWFRTSVFVKAVNFNKDSTNYKWVRPKDLDCGVKNDALRRFKERIEGVYFKALSEGSVSLPKLKALVQVVDSDMSLLNATASHADKLRALKKSNTAKAYDALRKRLEDYCRTRRKRDIMFSEVDELFIEDFDLYMHETSNAIAKQERKLKESTINMTEKRLRVVIRSAPEGAVKGDPFRTKSFERGVSSVKEVLTSEEISAMESAKLALASEDNARNLFLFSYYCNGMRAGDVLQLRWGNLIGDNRLSYRMTKTKKVRSLLLVGKAKEIIEKYRRPGSLPSEFIFPYLDDNAPWAKRWSGSDVDQLAAEQIHDMKRVINNKVSKIDHCLKSVAKAAGINKRITLHVARHSFSNQMLRSGVDPMIIKSALAHSSLKTTETYLRDFDTAEVDAAVQGVFEPQDTKKKMLEYLASLPEDSLAELVKNLKKSPQE